MSDTNARFRKTKIDKYFTQIPIEVFQLNKYFEDFDDKALLAYMKLRNTSESWNVTFKSMVTLLGVSEKQVNTRIQTLKEFGLYRQYAFRLPGTGKFGQSHVYLFNNCLTGFIFDFLLPIITQLMYYPTFNDVEFWNYIDNRCMDCHKLNTEKEFYIFTQALFSEIIDFFPKEFLNLFDLQEANEEKFLIFNLIYFQILAVTWYVENYSTCSLNNSPTCTVVLYNVLNYSAITKIHNINIYTMYKYLYYYNIYKQLNLLINKYINKFRDESRSSSRNFIISINPIVKSCTCENSKHVLDEDLMKSSSFAAFFNGASGEIGEFARCGAHRNSRKVAQILKENEMKWSKPNNNTNDNTNNAIESIENTVNENRNVTSAEGCELFSITLNKRMNKDKKTFPRQSKNKLDSRKKTDTSEILHTKMGDMTPEQIAIANSNREILAEEQRRKREEEKEKRLKAISSKVIARNKSIVVNHIPYYDVVQVFDKLIEDNVGPWSKANQFEAIIQEFIQQFPTHEEMLDAANYSLKNGLHYFPEKQKRFYTDSKIKMKNNSIHFGESNFDWN